MLNKNLMWYIYSSNSSGRMAELADAYALGAYVAIHLSSTLTSPTRFATSLGLIDKVVSTVLKSTEFTKLKFVAVNVALTTKCCKVERVCIEGFNSEPLARLRIYPPNSYVPTTAYFVAIPTTFF